MKKRRLFELLMAGIVLTGTPVLLSPVILTADEINDESYFLRYHTISAKVDTDDSVYKIFPLKDLDGGKQIDDETYEYSVIDSSSGKINGKKILDDGRVLVGWSTTNVMREDPETTDLYDYVDYWDGPNLGSLAFKTGGTVTLTSEKPTLHLYAVYAWPQVMGYSLSLPDAYFEVEETTDHKRLQYWSSTDTLHAPKFFVLNSGYEKSDTRVNETLTAPDPICPDHIFLGWYDKYADSSDHKFYKQGDDDVNIRPNSQCYSLDAMWAETNIKDKTIPYDGETFFTLDPVDLKISEIGDNLDSDKKSDRPERMEFFNDEISISRFMVSVDNSENTDQESVKVTVPDDFNYYELTFDEDLGQLMVGQYKYKVQPVLKNIPRDRENEQLDWVTGTLTVTPAELVINKEVILTAKAGEKVSYTFNENNIDADGVKTRAGDKLHYSATLSVTASSKVGDQVSTEYNTGDTLPSNYALSVVNSTIPELSERTRNYNVTEHLKITVVTVGGDTVIPTPTPTPKPDPTPVPDPSPDKPEYLNTEDHYAYIIGRDYKYAAPNETIAREEVATIFFRLLTDEARNKYWSTKQEYPDVYANLWHNNAIATITKMGIFEGYKDGTFKPNQPITRAELAKVAVSFFPGRVETASVRNFSDIKGHWAESYIRKAEALGLVQGYQDGTYRPDAYITRAEAMSIINNVLGRKPKTENFYDEKYQITWPDNQDKTMWYYSIIQEATNSHEYTDGEYETWTTPLPVRNWAAFEQEWADANAATNPGEVIG